MGAVVSGEGRPGGLFAKKTFESYTISAVYRAFDRAKMYGRIARARLSRPPFL